jgi:hypothetical protein
MSVLKMAMGPFFQPSIYKSVKECDAVELDCTLAPIMRERRQRRWGWGRGGPRWEWLERVSDGLTNVEPHHLAPPRQEPLSR